MNEARFHLDAGADDLARAGRLLGAFLPPLGAANLSGRVVASADEVAVTQLQGLIGEAELSGQLALSLARARPRVSGALSLTAFDLRPFLVPNVQPPGDTPAAAQAWMARSLMRAGGGVSACAWASTGRTSASRPGRAAARKRDNCVMVIGTVKKEVVRPGP